MGYVALRPIKAQLDTERKITVVQPGAKVPGAETWRNIKTLVQKGYLSFVDDGTPPQAKAASAPTLFVSNYEPEEELTPVEEMQEEVEEKKTTKKQTYKQRR